MYASICRGTRAAKGFKGPVRGGNTGTKGNSLIITSEDETQETLPDARREETEGEYDAVPHFGSLFLLFLPSFILIFIYVDLENYAY